MSQITVIVPVYKTEPYLRRCVDSILAQSFSDFELILVDDGSPDNCGAICDEYSHKDARIHVIHQVNSGLSAARNTGIEWAFSHSDSEWLFFVDSDDWIHLRTLEALICAANVTGLQVVIGGYIRTDDTMAQISDEQVFKPEIWNTDDFFWNHNVNAVVAWGKLYKKNCFRLIRYPIGKLHEDEAVTYKILFQYAKIAVIAAPLYYYYINTNGIMHSSVRCKRLSDYIDAMEERVSFFKERGETQNVGKTIKQMMLYLYGWMKKTPDDPTDELCNYRFVHTVYREQYKKYRSRFRFCFNKYERCSLLLLSLRSKAANNWVIQNDFEPIQRFIARVKGFSRSE